jgi:Coenzyme F420-dependent N5,N10-methylene tetrahydromethanopterin reductase and related flavin-dependent oxidoreductases
MRPPLRVGTVYDFRNTPESGMDMPSLYAAIMDQVVMLDGLGLISCGSPSITSSMTATCLRGCRWRARSPRAPKMSASSDVCLLPFNHPVRLAEDLAVLDNISNGRIEVGVGMGYAPHEFRGFGCPSRAACR